MPVHPSQQSSEELIQEAGERIYLEANIKEFFNQ